MKTIQQLKKETRELELKIHELLNDFNETNEPIEMEMSVE